MSCMSECTSLNPQQTKNHGSINEIETGDVLSFDNDICSTSMIKETNFICYTSIPLIITFFLQYSLTVVSIFSVGHIGKSELAAVSLAIMTFNVTSSFFNGMATSLDTLCAQAYGAKRYDLVGLYFQRCTAMILVCAIPIICLWCFSASILAKIVPEKDLVYLAQTYLRWISFGAPGYICFETGKRFLQAQGIYTAGQYSLFIVAPLNVILNYLLVWHPKFGLGFIGAPISTAICYWIMCFELLAYATFINGYQCWYKLEIRQAFDVSKWSNMMTLALNSTAMLVSEFIAFEILTVSASRFGTSSLAAQSIVSTMATLAFQIPFAVSVAISTRIANYVGGGMIINARIATKVSYLLSLALGVVNFSILVLARHKIANSFTNDVTVIKLAVKIILILGINQLYDCPNVMFAGCLRGQGRQKIGSSLNLIAYYIVAVPLGLILAFKFDLQLIGLWSGLGVGIFLLALSQAIVLGFANWSNILSDAKQRNSVPIH